MTLYKQLWIAIIIALSMIFVGSLFVSSLSAQQYLEEQVSGHNQNYANFLALLLNDQCSQEICDEAHLSTWLKPPIDQGYILSIKVISPLDEILFTDTAVEKTGLAPNWFKKTFPLNPRPGGVNIQSGWTALGALTLTSPIEGVYNEMWEGSKRLSMVYFLAMLLAGSIGSFLLGKVLKPLDSVVDQAEALGQRRFITTPEPWTLEFKKVVSAMNTLATRVKEMLEQEAETLNEYRRDLHEDKVTKLLNRDQFMTIFRATLARDDASGSGALSILRISDLTALNEGFGYQKVDAMLADLGKAIRWLTNINGGWTAARLNGSDFMILAPALKQRSKLYADSEDYFTIIPANRTKSAAQNAQSNTNLARPSIHIQVLTDDQADASSSISITQQPDMGDVIYDGAGVFIYSSEISVEGETEFSFHVTLDGDVVERSIKVTMASINDPLSVARELQTQVLDVFKNHGMQDATQLPTAAIYFNPGEPLGALMGALDTQIKASESEALSHIKVAYLGDMTAELSRELMADWKSIFDAAFEERSFELDLATVTRMDGSLLHYEANIRLRQEDTIFRGGEFLPWITRLNMTEQLDREMVVLALDEIETKNLPISVKLSAEVIREPAFAVWFEKTLSDRSAQHPLLSLQLLESMAFRYLDSFTQLCALARGYGVQTGIEHMGHQMEDIGRLFDVGMDFMKIDDFFITDVDKDLGNQNLLRTLTTLAHSIGVIAIAQGVSSEEEKAMVEKLGLDGASGPGITLED